MNSYKKLPYGVERLLGKASFILQEGKDFEKAFNAYRAAIKAGFTDPAIPQGVYDSVMGVVNQFPNDYEKILKWMDRGIKYTKDDDKIMSRFLYFRGQCLNRLGQFKEALKALESSLDLGGCDESKILEMNFAYFRGLREFDKSIKILDWGLASLAHDKTAVWRLTNEKASAHLGRAELRKAIALYDMLEKEGDEAIPVGMYNNKSLCLTGMGLFKEAREALTKAIARDLETIEPFSNVGMLALYDHTLSEEQVWAEHMYAGNEIKRIVGDVIATHTKLPRVKDSKIRVGYLGAQFCLGSALMRFFTPIFTKFDKETFELFFIDNICTPPEERKKYADHNITWIDIANLSTRDAAQRIAECKLDILVDTIGYTDNHRADIMSCRLARVQVVYAAYMYHTGSPNVDWIVGDKIQCSTDFDALAKKTYLLDCCYTHYTPSFYYVYGNDIPPLQQYPFYQLKRQCMHPTITFGSMNKAEKMNQDVIDLWDRILDAVPNSRLAIKSSRSELKFRNESRVFRMPIDHSQEGYVSQTLTIDIALDTFPWTGTTTTCDYLVLGIPVVTLLGPKFIQRSSASILHYSGLNRFIAKTKDEYFDIATSMARAIEDGTIDIMRNDVQQAFLKGPVCDEKVFMPQYENMLKNLIS